MRWLGAVPCLVLGALLAGCDRQPAEPLPDDAIVPALGATHDSWTTTFTFPDEGTLDYVECYNDGAGEAVRYFGSFVVHHYSTTTPSGNTTFHWKIDYPPPVIAVGLTSGDVWSVVRGEDTGAQVIKTPGEFQVYHWQANEWDRNQDGEEVHLSFRYQLHIDGDGNVQMARFDGYCPGKP